MTARTSLTGVSISDGYPQLLHVSDTRGITATLTDVYDANGTPAPIKLSTSSFIVNGGFGMLVRSITESDTAAAEAVILVDASSGAVVVTLTPVADSINSMYRIKKTDSSGNTVTVDGNSSETIDGGTTAVLTVQFESITIICDGSEWHIL